MHTKQPWTKLTKQYQHSIHSHTKQQQHVTATGVERLDQRVLLLPPLGMLENKGRNKGPLGRDPLPGPSNVPPTVREPHLVPLRGPLGAGVGRHLLLLILLWHLVTCSEHSSFFRQSCLQRTSPSMRRWWCLPQKRNEPRNESSCSGKRSNFKTGCGNKRLAMFNRLPSLKQMQRSNGPCFKVCETA